MPPAGARARGALKVRVPIRFAFPTPRGIAASHVSFLSSWFRHHATNSLNQGVTNEGDPASLSLGRII